VKRFHFRSIFGGQLAHRASETVILQPANRETAPGTLLPLTHVLRADPEAIVALFPSDHFVHQEERFMAHVLVAQWAVRRGVNSVPFTSEWQPVDVGALLSDVVKRVTSTLDAPRVRLSVPSAPSLVTGDPQRLERVFVNLLTNALKYSQADTEVLTVPWERR
jgi:signal transduction histidine kinase